jgi:hypothetical protein
VLVLIGKRIRNGNFVKRPVLIVVGNATSVACVVPAQCVGGVRQQSLFHPSGEGVVLEIGKKC